MLTCYYCKQPLPDVKQARCPHCGEPWRYIDEHGYDGYYDDIEPRDYSPEDDRRFSRLVKIVAGALGAIVIAVLVMISSGLFKGNTPEPFGESVETVETAGAEETDTEAETDTEEATDGI